MSAGKPAQPRWGRHCLDERAARRIVAHAGVRPGDLVLDLGAGTGAVTARLLEAQARVVAVELHPARLEQLRRRFAGTAVVVRAGDLRTTALPTAAFRVVANPPWTLAETVRARLLGSPHLIRADLVVPRWLAHRWAARYGRIVVGESIRAEAFRPAARTGAAVAIIAGRR